VGSYSTLTPLHTTRFAPPLFLDNSHKYDIITVIFSLNEVKNEAFFPYCIDGPCSVKLVRPEQDPLEADGLAHL
jgi:hypothetical protein